MKIWFTTIAEQVGPQRLDTHPSTQAKACLLLAQPATPRTASPTKKSCETARFFRTGRTISNRFWPKDRSFRKQTIKPGLTGARTPHSALRVSAGFPAEVREVRGRECEARTKASASSPNARRKKVLGTSRS